MITFKKTNYSEIPEDIRKQILNFSGDEVQLDDSKKSKIEMIDLINWLEENGYKEV